MRDWRPIRVELSFDGTCIIEPIGIPPPGRMLLRVSGGHASGAAFMCQFGVGISARCWREGLPIVGAIRAAIAGAAGHARRGGFDPTAQRALAGCASALNAHQINQPERFIVGPRI